MKPLRRASMLFFVSAVVVMHVALLRADPRIDCTEHGDCYPPWGTIVGPSGCAFIDMSSCINAAETCSQFCDTLGGVQAFSCNAGDGWCSCMDAEYCSECLLDPESCDPQTPFNPDTCSCQASPLILDLEGNGILLTSVDEGVEFDLVGNGSPRKMSWTRGNLQDAFLVLDRDGNGQITSGRELFGSLTPQSPSDLPNGFQALRTFDRVADGGNNDGIISDKDAGFRRLLVWIDQNHNGVSEPGELKPLSDVGVKRIALDYETDNRMDEFGNTFRLKARVWDNIAHTKFIWDVFLSVEPAP